MRPFTFARIAWPAMWVLPAIYVPPALGWPAWASGAWIIYTLVMAQMAHRAVLDFEA